MSTTETTETTDATTNEAQLPVGPHLVPVHRMLLGNNPAVCHSATIKLNHNGKLNIELDLTIGNRRIQHNMYLTTPAGAANTNKQLKNAFGIDIEQAKKDGTIRDELAKVSDTPCSVRIEDEEFNGRTSPRIKYVNPHYTTEASDEDFADLDFTAPSNIDEVAF